MLIDVMGGVLTRSRRLLELLEESWMEADG